MAVVQTVRLLLRTAAAAGAFAILSAQSAPSVPLRAKDSSSDRPGVSAPAKDSENAQSPTVGDIPKTFAVPLDNYDYVKREVMIPMRDGVKLHTVIVVPKGARNAPILLTRTPYNASKRTERNNSPHMLSALPLFDEVFAADGYIRVYQDVRGKYKSEGEYVMTRPVRSEEHTSE